MDIRITELKNTITTDGVCFGEVSLLLSDKAIKGASFIYDIEANAIRFKPNRFMGVTLEGYELEATSRHLCQVLSVKTSYFQSHIGVSDVSILDGGSKTLSDGTEIPRLYATGFLWVEGERIPLPFSELLCIEDDETPRVVFTNSSSVVSLPQLQRLVHQFFFESKEALADIIASELTGCFEQGNYHHMDDHIDNNEQTRSQQCL